MHAEKCSLVVEKMFNVRLMKKFNKHKQTAKSGKKGAASPCTILELMLIYVGITDWFYPAAVYKIPLDLQAKGPQQQLTTTPILQPVLLLMARMPIPTKQLTNPF